MLWSPARAWLLEIDAAALAGLGYVLARRRRQSRPPRRGRAIRPAADSSRAAPPAHPAAAPATAFGIGPRGRRPTGFLARSWHRRLAVAGRFAPWITGAALAGLLAASRAMTGFETTDPLPALILATLTPAVAAGLTWRERWRSLGYESLFPAGRGQFVREMASALAADVAEFWAPAVAAAAAVVVAWPPTPPDWPTRLAATLAASAMMQCLVAGGLFLTARSGHPMLYVGVLTALAAATAVPVSLAWSPHPTLAPTGLLAAAAGEMVVGLAMAWAGGAAWRRADQP